MAIYRKCTECGKKVEYGTKCVCEADKDKQRYKTYAKNRMKDKEEARRQRFYSSDNWIRLRDTARSKFNGLCIMCLIKDNKVKSEDYVHHIHNTKDYWERRLELNNLITLCSSHHKEVHRLMDRGLEDKVIKDLLKLIKQYENIYG